jgi:uncharacterized PurR-regulated membrane protein YhhQ (DUF165 family)
MEVAAFLALFVWYRHIGWWGNPYIPRYQSMLLLLPIQTSFEHLGILGLVLTIPVKGIIYGGSFLCIDLLKERFFPKSAQMPVAGG